MGGHRPFFTVNVAGFERFFVNHVVEQSTDAGFCPTWTKWLGNGFAGNVVQSLQVNGNIASGAFWQSVNVIQQYPDVIVNGKRLQAGYNIEIFYYVTVEDFNGEACITASWPKQAIV